MRRVMLGVAVASPVVSHVALALGHGYGVAAGLAAVQAVAFGGLVSGVRPRPWLGVGVGAALLGALGAGCAWSAERGLLAEAGVGHALLYAALLAGFGRTLRPGRTSVVTVIASRLNPGFHAGMVAYTRAVTWAWCGVFAGQLLASAVLLPLSVPWWRALVMSGHLAVLGAMAVGEHAVRRWRWRHERPTGLRATVMGVRRLWAAGWPPPEEGPLPVRTRPGP